MKAIYDKISVETSKSITKNYSTSFSLGIRFLAKKFQEPIYNVYGFVRVADEIVDTFHDAPQKEMLEEFRKETDLAIERKISTNPVLQSFQKVVNEYYIDRDLITTFLDSMEMDLSKIEYDKDQYEKYILGSAEVVGLMCLRVFVDKDKALYEKLKPSAMKLGSAFQKINFLRDLKDDYQNLGRMYFPGVEMGEFNDKVKAILEKEIAADFHAGYLGIKQLPKSSRFGVYVAYIYYSKLLKSISKKGAETLLHERVSIPNYKKYGLFVTSYVKHKLNAI
jgi:phytoene/squalene synthetase